MSTMRHDTALMMTKSTSISFYDTFYSLLFGDLSESTGIALEFHGVRTVEDEEKRERHHA